MTRFAHLHRQFRAERALELVWLRKQMLPKRAEATNFAFRLAFYALNGIFTKTIAHSGISLELSSSIVLPSLRPQSAFQAFGSAGWVVGKDDNGAAASSKKSMQRFTLVIYYGPLAERRRAARL